MNSKKILQKLRLHPTANVYQVGCTAVRLNVYAQQQRAFNLVWALQAEGKLPLGVSVAVVGGGIAGITAAAALTAAGATVKLFEKMSDVAHLQTGNVTRFLHPNIGLWPNETFGYSVTHIPFLNWRSDTAGAVAEKIIEQWKVHQSIHKKTLKTQVNSDVREVQTTDGAIGNIAVKSNHGKQFFDVVVVAAGYGLEKPQFADTPSYWRNDHFAQPILGDKSKRSYLVSGTGDGGLIEVLRLTINQFHHQRFIQAVMYDKALVKLGKQLESKLTSSNGGAVFRALISDKRTFTRTPEVFKLVRKDTKVYLNGRDDYPSKTPSQLLHRLCVALLIKKGIVEYVQGGLVDVYSNRESNEVVAWIRGSSGDRYIRVDEVIQRHNSASTLNSLFPKQKKLFERLREEFLKKDLTWLQHYPVGFLADAFMESHFEAAYEIGFKLLPRTLVSLQNATAEITTRLDAQAEGLEAWLDLVSGGIPQGPIDSTQTFDFTWKGKIHTLWLEEIDIVHFHGQDPQDVPTSWRQFLPTPTLCLILRTASRELVEFLFRADTLRYHIQRTYLAENVNLDVVPTPLVSADTNVFLVSRLDRNCLEVHGYDGMLQAHILLRVPTLLELLRNKWPTTKVHGFGWAVMNTMSVNRTEGANKLLQWNP